MVKKHVDPPTVLVEQLKKNLRTLGNERPEHEGWVRYVFPYAGALVAGPRISQRRMSRLCFMRGDALSRCPIYRSLSHDERLELMLRAPKSFIRHRHHAWTLLQNSQDSYENFVPGGVSPLTAMALLVPEPRYEIRLGGLSPLLVIPEARIHIDEVKDRSAMRPTSEWQVVVWATKRYQAWSWRDINSLSSDLKRNPTSLRATVRTRVEEPLAAFYYSLTGKALDPELYSCALDDVPESKEWARQRIRDLKRAAQIGRRRNPTI